MRTAQRRHRSIGQSLNLTPYTQHTCPPGYHWVDTPQGPIMGLAWVGNRYPERAWTGIIGVRGTSTARRLAACVPNPAAPPPPPPPAPRPVHTIRLSLGPRPAAPVLPPAPAIVRAAAPMVRVSPAAFTPEPVEAPAPADVTPAAPAAAASCNCWPLWWLVVALGAGAAAGYTFTGKNGKKRRKNAAEYVCEHVIRKVNPARLLGM